MHAQSTTVSDLAADSPLTYAELAELNRSRALAPRLATMSPRERIGAAALLAERTGRELSAVIALFGRLVEEGAAPQPPAPASPARAAQLVPSETDPKLVYIVRGHGASCSCPGFKFRGKCKHTRQIRDARAAGVVALLKARRAQAAAA